MAYTLDFALVFYLFALVTIVLALVLDVVLQHNDIPTISEQARKYPQLALIVIGWQLTLPMALIMHLYM